MKELYIASFIHQGILGGALYLTDTMTVFRTNKLTVDKKYRNLQIKYADILGCIGGWLICFPSVTITMKDGMAYKFVVFARKKYLNRIEELRR
ncbi:MAG: hypothetical protein K0S47_3339 [Herbinix sp.]|jgi:hypothetical protein|nr:hypothetical protein [Herbinix sp.]